MIGVVYFEKISPAAADKRMNWIAHGRIAAGRRPWKSRFITDCPGKIGACDTPIAAMHRQRGPTPSFAAEGTSSSAAPCR
jgi:hypothetical protein